MGFECGFKVVPRINNIDIEKYLYTRAHLDFDDNYWMKNNYNSFKEYFESSYSLWGDKIECKYPDIDFRMDDYREIKEDTIEWWCSIGRQLDIDYMQGQLDQIKPFEEYEVYEHWVDETLEKVRKSLKEEYFKPVSAVYYVHHNEDNEKVLKRCEGLLVEDEDGNQKLLDFYYDNIWMPCKYFDIDYHYAKERFVEVLEELQKINFNDNIVIYYRSY